MAPGRPIRPGVIPFWMLNDASTIGQKIEYMRACRAGGIEALCMHPRSGNLIPYGSDEWFEMIRALVEEGQRLDMDMWLYDEDPFPSGAAGGWVMAERPDLRGQHLAWHEMPQGLKPGELWTVCESRIVWAGLVPEKEPQPAVDLTGELGVVRTDWAMGDWDSRWYYPDTPLFPCPRGDAVRPLFAIRVPEVPDGYRLVALSTEMAGKDCAWGSLPDLLNPQTLELFRELTLERYAECVGEHFGKTIPGIFTDEAKPHGLVPITRDMFEDFRNTYHYDLRPRLYQLFGQPLGEEYVRTRFDYRRWVARRFLQAFLRPYRRWCDEHDLYLVGHLSPEDDPIEEAVTVGSVMPLMKELSFPGTDVIVPFTGDRQAPALNIGSLRADSLKSQHGHPYCTSETLGLSGWTVTSQKSRQLFAWQKVLGVDRFFVHGFFGANDGVLNYEAPPDFGPNSSVFKGICEVNRWAKRVEALTDGAEVETEVAILSSVLPFWASGIDVEAPSLRRMRKSLWLTALACLRAHVPCHVVGEEDLGEAQVSRGRIAVSKRAYRAVLVPGLDVIGEDALARLKLAAETGASVFWFDGGPTRLVRTGSQLADCPALPGEVLAQRFPSALWCSEHFKPHATVRGRMNGDCYVRRCCGKDGQAYLLAANISDLEFKVTLGPEEDGVVWMPVTADGDVSVGPGGTGWRAPACGAGLFRLASSPGSGGGRPTVLRRITGESRTFTRMGPNVLRLSQCTVAGKGVRRKKLEFPRPYWQLSHKYSVRHSWPSYLGELPVVSSVADGELRYSFRFRVDGAVKGTRVVLDPRCARGRFRIVLNGKQVGPRRDFPLSRARPLHVPLTQLKQGANALELRFRPQSAMDGLLSQLYLEGNFDVSVGGAKGRPTISPPRGRVTKKGWQEGGLPHYMGEGVYRWEEDLNEDDLRTRWTLEVEKVLDSAELLVNGQSMGTRAWTPWRWALANLREGSNTFELQVSGTAGNKHELVWPNQPQGGIGDAWLVGESAHRRATGT